MKKRFDKIQNYVDALSTICAMQVGWDGYNPNSAKQMRGLMMDMVEVAGRGINGQPVFLTGDEMTYKIYGKTSKRSRIKQK